MTEIEIVEWWRKWYLQETKLEMPKIAKIIMLKQLKELKQGQTLPIHDIIECFPLAMDTLQLPAKYDYNGQTILDKDNNKILDVRGWGNIKYLDEPEKRQDSIGELLTELLNAL